MAQSYEKKEIATDPQSLFQLEICGVDRHCVSDVIKCNTDMVR